MKRPICFRIICCRVRRQSPCSAKQSLKCWMVADLQLRQSGSKQCSGPYRWALMCICYRARTQTGMTTQLCLKANPKPMHWRRSYSLPRTAGGQLAAVFDRLDKEVAEALDREDTIRKAVREVVFPTLTARSNAPGEAGVFQATTQELKSTQANILFNGGTEGCDGTCAVHDT